MRKPKKNSLAAVLFGALILGGLQALPVARTNPPEDGAWAAPADLEPLVRAACYDCHSHRTAWPWYSRIAPVSWIVAADVRAGRQALNFSRWNQYSPRSKARQARRIAGAVERGEMPLALYTWAHPAARLSAAQRRQLINGVARRPAAGEALAEERP